MDKKEHYIHDSYITYNNLWKKHIFMVFIKIFLICKSESIFLVNKHCKKYIIFRLNIFA